MKSWVKNGDWYQIKYGDKTGYSKKEFFKVVENKNKVENTTNTANAVSNTTNSIENTANVLLNETTTNTVENKANVEEPAPEETQPLTNTEIAKGDILTLKTSVKIRKIPNFSAKTQNVASENISILIDSIYGNWCKISADEFSGWITKQNILKSVDGNIETNSTETEQSVDNKPTNTVAEKKPETTENTTNTVSNTTNKVENTTNATENTTNTATSDTTTLAKTAVVNVETARVRENASKNGKIIGTLDEDDVINIIEEENGFYKFTSDTISGYISKTVVEERDVTSRSSPKREDETTVPQEANSVVSLELSKSDIGDEVVEYAKQYLGYSYVSGSASPKTGFDCSGFTKYVYSNFDYKLGSTSYAQSTEGTEISREDMQNGDLIIFYNESRTSIGHVGIYIGNDNFIHSANPDRGVVIDNLKTNTYYDARFVSARRIIN